MKPVTFELPWPDSALSPNARLHFMAVVKAKRKARADAHMLAYAAGVRPAKGVDRLSVSLTFCPPSGRHFDADNLIARCKAAMDGIADATGINDRNFELAAPAIARPKPPHGCVIVTLQPVAKREAA